MRDGIVYVTQYRKLEGFFETMLIAGNIQTAEKATGANPLKIVSMAKARALAKSWIKALSIRAIDGNARIIELSGGNQQKVVIPKSLVRKPKLIIFDQPTRGVATQPFAASSTRLTMCCCCASALRKQRGCGACAILGARPHSAVPVRRRSVRPALLQRPTMGLILGMS